MCRSNFRRRRAGKSAGCCAEDSCDSARRLRGTDDARRPEPRTTKDVDSVESRDNYSQTERRSRGDRIADPTAIESDIDVAD